MIFAVVVAAFLLFSNMYRREFKNKIQATGDYLLWTSWGTPISEKERMHQKEIQSSSSSKTIAKSNQSQESSVTENRGMINNSSDVAVSENTASSSVEDGAQTALKTFDLNDLLP